MITKTCIVCGKEFKVSPSHASMRKRCSRTCYGVSKRRIVGETKQCNKCKKILPRSEYSKDAHAPGGLYRFCKSCHIETNRQYRINNREYYRKSRRDYMRKYRIGNANGDHKNVKNKRPYPVDECCEICKREKHLRLGYHHWDDNHPELGIWACKPCHDMCGGIEKGLDIKYKTIKQSIINTQVNR